MLQSFVLAEATQSTEDDQVLVLGDRVITPFGPAEVCGVTALTSFASLSPALAARQHNRSMSTIISYSIKRM